MMRTVFLIKNLAICSGAFFLFGYHTPTDDQIKNEIINKSKQEYSKQHGNCPCPNDEARDGTTCGERSAYTQSNGEEPKCYPQDVSPREVQTYRKKLPK